MKKVDIKLHMRRCEAADLVKRFRNACGTVDSRSKERDDGASIHEETSQRRSHRVLLQVAVLITADLSDGRRVQVQAFTLVVNAHGGLLESPLTVASNQKVTLVNPQTGKEVGCRVVRAKRTSTGLIAFAFEFDDPSAEFWPISFQPDDWGTILS
jgi:hypothetical protein